jgi:hypothetical protein
VGHDAHENVSGEQWQLHYRGRTVLPPFNNLQERQEDFDTLSLKSQFDTLFMI